MLLPEAIEDTISLLQGDEFCASFGGEPGQACARYIAEFVPIGWPVIAEHIRHHRTEECNEVYDNVCA